MCILKLFCQNIMPINFHYLKGISWFILSLLISILNDTCMKHLSSNLNCMQITFLRFSFSCLCLLPCMFILGINSLKTNRIKIHLFRGGILFLSIALWCYGLTVVPIANATLVTFIIPLFVLIMAPIFLKEQINLQLVIATLIGFLGALISLNIFAVDFDLINLVLIISAFLFATLDIINKKCVIKETMLSMLFYPALITSLLGAIPAYITWTAVNLHDLVIFIYLGVGSNLILFCLLRALKCLPASTIAPYRYLELIFAAIIGYMIFNENPSQMMIIGSMLIIPSTIYITLRKISK